MLVWNRKQTAVSPVKVRHCFRKCFQCRERHTRTTPFTSFVLGVVQKCLGEEWIWIWKMVVNWVLFLLRLLQPCFLCDFTCIDTCVRILCTNTILMLQELKNTKFKAHPPQVCMMKSFYCIWLQVRLVGLARHGTRKCILSEVVFVNLKKLLHVAINILYDTISHVEL